MNKNIIGDGFSKNDVAGADYTDEVPF
jgi:hypothetical protein